MSRRTKLTGVAALLVVSIAIFGGAATTELARVPAPVPTEMPSVVVPPAEAVAEEAVTIRLQSNVQIHGPGHMAGSSVPLVDGTRNPDQVPERLALRILFQAIAIPPNPGAADRARLRTRVGRIDLDGDDMEALTGSLGRFHQRLTAQKARIEERRQQARSLPVPASISSYATEQARITTLVEDAYDDALQSLSPAGANKLRQHVEHMKTRIKIYPTPDMASGLQ